MAKGGSIGKKILELRLERHLTQADLARRIKTTPQSVSRWERGEDEPRLPVLSRLAEVMSVKVEWFLDLPVGEPGDDAHPGDSPIFCQNRKATRALVMLERLAKETDAKGEEWDQVEGLLRLLTRDLPGEGDVANGGGRRRSHPGVEPGGDIAARRRSGTAD